MIRCPRCGYEFVESGRFVDMLRRWIRRAPVCHPERSEGPGRVGCGAVPPAHPAPSTTLGMTVVVSLLELPVGATASILNVDATSAARLSRLASYGIAAGSEVQLLARRPAVVVACGSSSIAVEDDVAREIQVRAISSPAA